ncbi:RIP metalloprotease RseP [Rhodovibrionaceae bacterium A322]
MELFALIQDYLVPFLVILTVLVFVHEWGHYWVAKKCGVKIEAFSIGFGPEIFGRYDKSGTRWKFCAIPLGGYVKMFGDADVTSRPAAGAQAEEQLEPGQETGDWAGGQSRPLTDAERAQSFHHKNLGQRAAIVAAGPAVNFLFAMVLLTGYYAFVGQQTTLPVIGQVVEGSAAERAGFLPGDKIIEINGNSIDRFEEIQRLVQINLNETMAVVVDRDGQEVSFPATPDIVERQDRFGNTVKLARLGITASGTERVRLGFVTSMGEAVVETYELSVGTLKAVGQIITGARGTEELGGPIRIAEMSGQVAELGLDTVIWFMAVLSVNLGLINLFPVPMLDGGHLLFYAIELVRGRPLGEKAQEIGFKIGMALVFSLIVFVTWNDLMRLPVFEFFSGLVT